LNGGQKDNGQATGFVFYIEEDFLIYRQVFQLGLPLLSTVISSVVSEQSPEKMN